MTRRREHPLPRLPISLESLPPPDKVVREKQVTLRFTRAEYAMIQEAARARGEGPSVLLRAISLAAFENSALRALGERPDLLGMSPPEQQKVLLEAFSFEEQPARKPYRRPESLPPLPPKHVHRDRQVTLRYTPAEYAMIEKAAVARGEQPSVLLRTVSLTAFQNSALRTPGEKRDFHEMSPIEQQKALLEAFSFEEEPSRKPS